MEQRKLTDSASRHDWHGAAERRAASLKLDKSLSLANGLDFRGSAQRRGKALTTAKSASDGVRGVGREVFAGATLL
jgi:hypothetical protein